MISVLILTKNEEKDLPGCLATVKWSDDIHVYDSFSSDRTVEIAREAGAKITQRKFDNWSNHQNWGLRNIAFKNDWVYYIDADERLPSELVVELHERVRAPQEFCAFRGRRRDYLFGRWLKHVTPSPFNIRLFRPEKMKYERLVNPVPIVDGPVGELTQHFVHYSFSKGFAHWFEKHNAYSTLEAQQIEINRSEGRDFSLLSAFIEKDANIRRFHQKELFYRLPARPLVKFALLYFGRRGFLDGHAGFTYAILQSIYEYMIVLKQREVQTQP